MIRKFALISMTVWLLGLAVKPAAAYSPQDCPVCTRTPSDHHPTKVAATFTRGAGNIAFCWLELVRVIGNLVLSPMPKAKDDSRLAKSCPLCIMEAP